MLPKPFPRQQRSQGLRKNSIGIRVPRVEAHDTSPRCFHALMHDELFNRTALLLVARQRGSVGLGIQRPMVFFLAHVG